MISASGCFASQTSLMGSQTKQRRRKATPSVAETRRANLRRWAPQAPIDCRTKETGPESTGPTKPNKLKTPTASNPTDPLKETTAADPPSTAEEIPPKTPIKPVRFPQTPGTNKPSGSKVADRRVTREVPEEHAAASKLGLADRQDKVSALMSKEDNRSNPKPVQARTKPQEQTNEAQELN